MKQSYIDKSFRADSLAMIETIDAIIRDYVRQGYMLTVRQLYYQLVARDIIANTLQEYKRIAGLINDAKLAGYLDWDAIEDRTRDFISRPNWSSGSSILSACAEQFHMDMWVSQQNRVFVIIEKEALVGVLERVCRKYDVPLLAARGYPSGSVLREFAVEKLMDCQANDQDVTVLHLGDHDPSGIDMTRDLQERLSLFAEFPVNVERIALNMDQIRKQRPPENPAKSTDSRFAAYRREYGSSSWELDALTPQFLSDLVENNVANLIDEDKWDERQAEIDEVKKRIKKVSDAFDNEE